MMTDERILALFRFHIRVNSRLFAVKIIPLPAPSINRHSPSTIFISPGISHLAFNIWHLRIPAVTVPLG